MLFRVIISTIGGLQTFTAPRVMVGSSGGTGQSGLTTFLYLYNRAFGANDYGDAAAVALSIFMLVLLFMAINWRLSAAGVPGRAMSWHRVKPARVLLHMLLALAGLLCLFPSFWTLVMATNTTADIYRFPPKFTFGSQFDDNVRQVLANGLLRLDAEHRDRRGLVTALVLFFDSLAAFTFANLRFPGGTRSSWCYWRRCCCRASWPPYRSCRRRRR